MLGKYFLPPFGPVKFLVGVAYPQIPCPRSNGLRPIHRAMLVPARQATKGNLQGIRPFID